MLDSASIVQNCTQRINFYGLRVLKTLPVDSTSTILCGTCWQLRRLEKTEHVPESPAKYLA